MSKVLLQNSNSELQKLGVTFPVNWSLTEIFAFTRDLSLLHFTMQHSSSILSFKSITSHGQSNNSKSETLKHPLI